MSKTNSSTKRPRVKDTETFIAAAKIIHGERYNYDLVEYTKSTEKVTIICAEHGPFEQRAFNHLQKHGCHPCGDAEAAKVNERKRLKGAQNFIKNARAKHKDRYLYSQIEYKDSKTKLKIVCKVHGPFEQSPNSHLRGQGCPECGREKIRDANERKRLEAARLFVEKARKKHGDRYRYDRTEYKKWNVKVYIECLEHGHFKQTPDSHLSGAGCPTCASIARKKGPEKQRLEAAEAFIRNARLKHGDTYIYDLAEYETSKAGVTIICKEHGPFKQNARNHLNGAGCPTCAREVCGCSRTQFIERAKRNKKGARLYLIHCKNKDETFYKIGITATGSTHSRFKNSGLPYKYEEIKTVTGEAGFIYDLETRFHRMNKAYKYAPKIPFSGHTECFSEITADSLFLLDVI